MNVTEHDSARVAEWMSDVGVRVMRAQSLPDPTYIWLRAQLEQRDHEARAGLRARPIVLGLAAGLVAAAAAVALLPTVSAAVETARSALLAVEAEAPPGFIALLGTAWLGLPLLLAAIYALVLRPLR